MASTKPTFISVMGSQIDMRCRRSAHVTARAAATWKEGKEIRPCISCATIIRKRPAWTSRICVVRRSSNTGETSGSYCRYVNGQSLPGLGRPA